MVGSPVPRLTIEQRPDNVSVVGFVSKKVLDEVHIASIDDELVALANSEKTGKRTIVVDMGNLQFMSSALFPALMKFHRALDKRGDKLVLADINKNIFETFKMIKVDKMLTCYPELKPDAAIAEAAKGHGR